MQSCWIELKTICIMCNQPLILDALPQLGKFCCCFWVCGKFLGLNWSFHCLLPLSNACGTVALFSAFNMPNLTDDIFTTNVPSVYHLYHLVMYCIVWWGNSCYIYCRVRCCCICNANWYLFSFCMYWFVWLVFMCPHSSYALEECLTRCIIKWDNILKSYEAHLFDIPAKYDLPTPFSHLSSMLKILLVHPSLPHLCMGDMIEWSHAKLFKQWHQFSLYSDWPSLYDLIRIHLEFGVPLDDALS